MNQYSEWKHPRDGDLPPEDTVVETVDSGGGFRDLVRKGNLWFFPDYSMYVYFVPQAWRLKDGGEVTTLPDRAS